MRLISKRQEKERALYLLDKGFQESEGMLWMLKNRKHLNKLLNFLLDESIEAKGAFLTDDSNGVLLYSRLQDQKRSFRIWLRQLHLLVFVLGLKNGLKAIKYRKIVDSIRPKEGWCGWLVTTDSAAVGTEAAYEIKNEMFRMAQATNEPVFVETTIKRVRILYERAGYTEYHQMKHPYQDLTVWFMRKDP